MKFVQNVLRFAITRIVPVFLLTFMLASTLLAQDTIDVSDPSTYVGEGNLNLLQVALTVLLSYLTGLFPSLAKFKPYVRAGAVALLITGAFVIFKIGAFNEESFKLVLATFLPNFAYSGFAWEALKWLLGLLGVNIKPPTPAVNG